MAKKKQPEEIVTLGLDLATDLTGYAVFKGRKRIASGTIKSIGSKKYTKFNHMKAMIIELCKGHNVDEVAVEDIMLKYNPVTKQPMLKTYKALAEMRGALICELVAYGVKENSIETYTAAEWRAVHKIKQGRGVKRDVTKDSAMEKLKESMPDATIDEVEAVLIAMAHIIKKFG
ncbi:MAG: crossover junction endodeoxyribonuclease RuvC [Paraclostridium sp.]